MAASFHAESPEADGPLEEAQGDIQALPFSAPHSGDSTDQPDPARLGELLSLWELESMFLFYPHVGSEEDQAALDAIPEATRLWMEEME